MSKIKLFLIVFLFTLSACTTGQKKADGHADPADRMERYQMMFRHHAI